MCGIFAIFCRSSQRLPDDAQLRLERALDAIKHRGPDARGSHIDSTNRFAVGHVRLSVIDIAASSNQPFWSSCGRFFVVYNGEIYNYLEIRAELEKEGVVFRTKSDTEVLLMALMHWGPSAINRFNGMWSFVYVDTHNQQFLISRDRLGVKPLFTYEQDGVQIICSEAKGILAWLGSTPKPNAHAIGLYLKFGIGGANKESWFEGIGRFPQASYQLSSLRAGTTSSAPIVRYWEYPLQRTVHDLDEAKERFDFLLTDAIKLRLRSDVPVGLSLSGGIDSSIIAGLVGSKFQRNLEVYTAWHPPVEQSELPMAQRIAAQFGHQSTAVPATSHNQLVTDLRTCIYHLDSAHNSPAIVPYLNLCRAARTTLTVMLEGQGADELLGGYTPFKMFAGLDYLLRGRIPATAHCIHATAQASGLRNFALDCMRFGSSAVYKRQALRWGAQRLLCRESLDALPEQFDHFSFSRSNFSNALKFSHAVNLTNLLQYGDAVSMSVNLETRCPFLDYRLVEFSFSLDTELLMHHGYGKYILRKCADPILPPEICWRRTKDGFGNSTSRMIRELVEQRGLPPLANEIALDHGLFQPGVGDVRVFSRLPENIQFRIFSALQWLEIFYE